MSYRSAAGPAQNYDVLGAKQFCVLVNHGLREGHYLLDIGCGPIRGGKLFIPYLLPGRYFGVDPNTEAVNAGIANELSEKYVLVKKKATFWFDGTFYLSRLAERPEKFDFILAQSIFSHTSRAQTERCIEQASMLMHKGSKFLGTWFTGHHNWEQEGWKPGSVVTRPTEYLIRLAEKYGMSFSRQNYTHPSGQTWFLMRRK